MEWLIPLSGQFGGQEWAGSLERAGQCCTCVEGAEDETKIRKRQSFQNRSGHCDTYRHGRDGVNAECGGCEALSSADTVAGSGVWRDPALRHEYVPRPRVGRWDSRSKDLQPDAVRPGSVDEGDQGVRCEVCCDGGETS